MSEAGTVNQGLNPPQATSSGWDTRDGFVERAAPYEIFKRRKRPT